MAGLNDLNSGSPDGKSALSLGDNAIRLVITKLLEFAAIEHALTGEHKFKVGSIAQRPAAGNAGRFYILTVSGVAAELQYDTGSAWVALTKNQTVIDYADALAAHAVATVLAHPDSSVTSAKMAPGSILKKHLDGSSDVTSLAELVDGSNADELHTHSAHQAGTNGLQAYVVAGQYWFTVPSGVYRLYCTYSGAGQGGGAGSGYGMAADIGGNGGWPGAAFHAEPLAVTPGEVIPLIVGAGGAGAYKLAGGVTVTPAVAGGNTTITGLPVAPGGGTQYLTGMVPFGSPGVGGNSSLVTPATAGGATLAYAGGAAGGSYSGLEYGGGGGGASFWGVGGYGGNPSYAGGNGGNGGLCAGGGGMAAPFTAYTGGNNVYSGNGGDGIAIITW